MTTLFGTGTFDVPIEFPEWATDMHGISPTQRSNWAAEQAIRMKYHNYFSGMIFEERIEDEDVDDPPLAYPVGINLARMLCLASADAIFGEWSERVVSWEAHQDDKVTKAEETATVLANSIMDNSSINTMLWEVDLDREIYGGGVIKINVDLAQYPHVQWTRVALNNFFPIWDPDNSDKLIECFVVIPMTREQAKAKYGIVGQKEVVYRVEHWTEQTYTNYVDGERIDIHSGLNPWGVVPFVYIPRYRSHHWFGDSLVEEVIKPQNEINEVLADIGETISYNAFPIRFGLNLPNSFNTANYPIAANALWDLGKKVTDQAKPEVGVLESANAISQSSLDYLQILFDFALYGAMVPPIAVGMDTGGGQRSGITVEIRLGSLVRSIRRSRAYMITGLTNAMKITGLILKQKAFRDISSFAVNEMLAGNIFPSFASVLPRDQAAVIDEIQKAMSAPVPLVSLETAVKKLGYGTAEVARIIKMIQDSTLGELIKPKKEVAPKGTDGRVAANDGGSKSARAD